MALFFLFREQYQRSINNASEVQSEIDILLAVNIISAAQLWLCVYDGITWLNNQMMYSVSGCYTQQISISGEDGLI